MATSADVARALLAELDKHGWLDQVDAVDLILTQFGDDFVYENENGNEAISRGVLNEFRKLTEDTVIWEPRERSWRKREPGDPEGRRAW